MGQTNFRPARNWRCCGRGGTPRRNCKKAVYYPCPMSSKPNGSGSSASVYIVREETPKLLAAICHDDGLGDEPIYEAYIPGRELTVSIKDGRALCVTEIIPTDGWYDYDSKYKKRRLSPRGSRANSARYRGALLALGRNRTSGFRMPRYYPA